MQRRQFLRDRGLDDATVRKVWLSIALHTTPGVPEFLDPEIALVTAGVETDVLGIRFATTSSEDARNAVQPPPIPGPTSNARYCRRSPTANRHRPGSTFGNVNADVLAHFDPTFVRDDFVDIILKNGWPE